MDLSKRELVLLYASVTTCSHYFTSNSQFVELVDLAVKLKEELDKGEEGGN